jgi:hypothetical protein
MSLTDAHLRRALADIDATVAGMSAEALAWHQDGRWSSAAILDHLAKAYGGTAYILRKCLGDGAPKGRPSSMRQRFFTFVITRLGWFPTGVKAPAVSEPDGLGPDEALAAARSQLAAFDEVAAQCRARFGPRALVANHPLLGGFTVDQWRRFHRVHTRHHMRQIARLRAVVESRPEQSVGS